MERYSVNPFHPQGRQLPLLTPTTRPGVASQTSTGPSRSRLPSWLQNQATMQLQANFYFANYASPQTAPRRPSRRRPYPAAWQMIAGINVGDIVTLENGSRRGGTCSRSGRPNNRKIRFGGQNNNNAGEGEVVSFNRDRG